MELMANSDNVLRGGLTRKHVDVPELLNVLRFEVTDPEILKPVQSAPGIRRYITPAEEFSLSEVTVDGNMRFENRNDASVEILICLSGEARADNGFAACELKLSRGMSMIVPASVKNYSLEGKAVFYRASVGNI
jgi:mannose-6-phosphate isomerase